MNPQVDMAVEVLMEELFKLHDLNQNGLLEELELIKLNEKISMLHYGVDADRSAVKAKFQKLFRTELDPNGHSVPFAVFRDYTLRVLEELDSNVDAQVMILEQLVAEARCGIAAFRCPSFASATDAMFMPELDATSF